jgi:hypothetical protein
MTENAMDIYQRNLDEVAQAIWEKNFEAALAHFAFPKHMATPDADVTIHEPEAMLQALAELRESLSRIGATAFLRICKEAVFDPRDEDRIIGSHVSYVLRGGTNVVPPYTSRMVLVRQPDGWKSVDIVSEASNRYLTVIGPDIALGHRTPRES